MPNWCANRLRVTGLAENVSRIRGLMAGTVRPSYVWEKAQGYASVTGPDWNINNVGHYGG